jgi:hypothetical protein
VVAVDVVGGGCDGIVMGVTVIALRTRMVSPPDEYKRKSMHQSVLNRTSRRILGFNRNVPVHPVDCMHPIQQAKVQDVRDSAGGVKTKNKGTHRLQRK